MNAGDVFRFNGIAERHVWMIVSDPLRDPAKVLIVNFTSHAPHLDQSCRVAAGEHPFIEHLTVVNYAKARTVTDEQLNQLRAAGRLELLEPLSAALLRKIRDAAMESPTLALDFADILLDQELVE